MSSIYKSNKMKKYIIPIFHVVYVDFMYTLRSL